MRKLLLLMFSNSKGMPHFSLKTSKGKETKKGKSWIRTWSKLKKLMHKRFILDNYKHDLYLRGTSLSQ